MHCSIFGNDYSIEVSKKSISVWTVTGSRAKAAIWDTRAQPTHFSRIAVIYFY